MLIDSVGQEFQQGTVVMAYFYTMVSETSAGRLKDLGLK